MTKPTINAADYVEAREDASAASAAEQTPKPPEFECFVRLFNFEQESDRESYAEIMLKVATRTAYVNWERTPTQMSSLLCWFVRNVQAVEVPSTVDSPAGEALEESARSEPSLHASPLDLEARGFDAIEAMIRGG